MTYFMKFPLERLDDPRLGMLDDATYGRYWKLYAFAVRLDAGGAFIRHGRQLTADEIAYSIRSTADQVKTDLQALKKLKLLHMNGRGPEITDYDIEQGPSREEQRVAWRERQHKHRSRSSPVTRDNSMTGSDERNVTGESHQVTPQNQTKSQTKNQTKSQTTDKSVTPPHTGMTAADWKSLTAEQRAAAEVGEKILLSAGLGKEKARNLLVILATRSSPEKLKSYVLGGLAAAYANPKARNKPIIAAMSMMDNEVPPEFMSPSTWGSLPKEILNAAGISSLAEHVQETTDHKIFRASEAPQIKAVPNPRSEEVREKIRALANAKAVRK